MDFKTIATIALSAIIALAVAWKYLKFPDFSAALASLSRKVTAAPADVVEPKTDPADLLMDAARLYVQRGEHAKAVKVFAMAAEPEGGA